MASFNTSFHDGGAVPVCEQLLLSDLGEQAAFGIPDRPVSSRTSVDRGDGELPLGLDRCVFPRISVSAGFRISRVAVRKAHCLDIDLPFRFLLSPAGTHWSELVLSAMSL
jgi:hypothetical protein